MAKRMTEAQLMKLPKKDLVAKVLAAYETFDNQNTQISAMITMAEDLGKRVDAITKGLNVRINK